jgi:hypothetical protein
MITARKLAIRWSGRLSVFALIAGLPYRTALSGAHDAKGTKPAEER